MSKIKLSCLLLNFLSFSVIAAHPLKDSRQLLLVLTKDWDSVKGSMQRYQRATNQHEWIVVGRPIPVVVGKNGLAWGVNAEVGALGPIKREGDLRSPSGIFAINSGFGFATKRAKHIHIPYQALTQSSVCIDDAASRYYNQIINTSSLKKRDWKTGEQMIQVPQYKLGALIEYNTNKPKANAGSCIFMHIWRSSAIGTAGCVAMAEYDLTHVLYWLDSQNHPVIALMTEDVFNQHGKTWGLPVYSQYNAVINIKNEDHHDIEIEK